MSHRVFVDPAGLSWQVWSVIPSAPGVWAGRDSSARALSDHPVPVAPPVHLAMQHGWLAFQAGAAHRRFMGIPAGWEGESDAGLVRLLSQAEQVERRRQQRG